MAVKGIAEITVSDLTDAYNVSLSTYQHNFEGTVDHAKAGSITIQPFATCGGSITDCNVPDTGDYVITGEVTGLTATVQAKAVGALAPTIVIAATTSFTTPTVLTIPVVISTATDGDLVFNAQLSVGINFAPDEVSEVKYQAGSSATTAPTGTWSSSPVSVSQGQYLWTRTTYASGKIAYSVARQGSNGTNGTNGTSVTVSSVAYAYAKSTSATTPPTSGWSTTVVAPTTTQYAWTRTTVTFSDGETAVTYSVGGKVGVSNYVYVRYSESSTGSNMTATPTDDTIYIGVYSGTASSAPTSASSYTWSRYTGQSPYKVEIRTTNGNILKNNSGSTALTAIVYSGEDQLTSLPSGLALKWYKDGSSTAISSGISQTTIAGDTLTVNASSITTKAVFVVQLEETA